jgi:hypothetical protein
LAAKTDEELIRTLRCWVDVSIPGGSPIIAAILFGFIDARPSLRNEITEMLLLLERRARLLN